MYNSIRRERPYSMQTLVGRGSPNNLNSQSRAIAAIALILFAVAGLLSGFAVGAFIRPAQQQLANNQNSALTPPTQGQAHSGTPNTHPQRPLPMNGPTIEQFQHTEIANGNTSYTVIAQAIDKKNQAIHKQGITCKLWLTRDANINANMPTSRLTAIDTLAQPFPKEVQGVLNFDTATPQTQSCNSNGQGKWNYTVSTSADHGTYYLIVLADWSGTHFAWSWETITIKKGD